MVPNRIGYHEENLKQCEKQNEKQSFSKNPKLRMQNLISFDKELYCKIFYAGRFIDNV